jgi:pimeloyl-ACP methyl ester carboxylesterase
MAQSKTPSKAVSHSQQSHPAHPTISGRWLLTALAISIPAAAFCTWAVFCLLFWQGSWQLLYHPTSTVSRTPSNIGLAFDTVSLATTDTGVPQIHGWWIPSPSARYNALYLHDQSGNLGYTLNMLAELHASGLNVLAFDYRGYGQSQFVHPSEKSWRLDATSALDYLVETRHIDRHSIVIVGSGLGANLALELAAAHPDLAGVVLQSPIDAPANVIFNDARSKLIPVRLLVRDRYDLNVSAPALRMPSLWLINAQDASLPAINLVFGRVNAQKTRVLLSADETIAHPLQSWLANLKN